VFSLGAIAYRSLTGSYPSAVAPELIAGVPTKLSALICRMLAPDPDHRPSADEVNESALALSGDRVRTTPRFTRPRWTPAPSVEGTEPRESSEIIELVNVRPRT
jgi:hypothetical protein